MTPKEMMIITVMDAMETAVYSYVLVPAAYTGCYWRESGA
ncbi:hypothetical protein EYZ11_013322 [Aspergillus tanneri]|uniref:Uncharacterized protein n=1 Tax=Aspergillus tanneri TaxID=1220188 RepID=A0A4S3IXX9_9EURO|nr:hypothetical protein EYZ11_013322 [Aspergillus tanneri]